MAGPAPVPAGTAQVRESEEASSSLLLELGIGPSHTSDYVCRVQSSLVALTGRKKVFKKVRTSRNPFAYPDDYVFERAGLEFVPHHVPARFFSFLMRF